MPDIYKGGHQPSKKPLERRSMLGVDFQSIEDIRYVCMWLTAKTRQFNLTETALLHGYETEIIVVVKY